MSATTIGNAKILLGSTLFALALAAGSPAQALPLAGTTANGQLGAGVCCGNLLNQNQLVGPGIEFNWAGNAGTLFKADLSDTQIVLSFDTRNAGTIGADLFWQFTLEPSLLFAGIAEVSDNFVNGANLVSFAGNVATFRIPDHAFGLNQSYSATYNVTVRQTNNVPEPLTSALLLAGFAGIGALRRRRLAA